MAILESALGGVIGYYIGKESKRNRNPTVPTLTKAQSKKRVKQLRDAGCNPQVFFIGGDRVITKDKGCKVPPIQSNPWARFGAYK